MVGQEVGSTAMISIFFPPILSRTKGRARPAKLLPPAGAADDDIRIIPDFLELFLGFQSDDGLMEQDMVQHAAQGIFASGVVTASSTASLMAMPRLPG